MSFEVGKKQEGANLVLELKGSIDEDASFTNPDLGGSTAVVLDLEGINSINSVGIREWIKWMKGAFPSNLQLSVRRCPKIIVDQINMVSGFLPANAKVESFYVPFYADGSGSEKM